MVRSCSFDATKVCTRSLTRSSFDGRDGLWASLPSGSSQADSFSSGDPRPLPDVASQPVFAANLRSGLEACGVEVRDCGRWGRKESV